MKTYANYVYHNFHNAIILNPFKQYKVDILSLRHVYVIQPEW